MQVRVDPEVLGAAAGELSGDGPTLRAAANVLAAHEYAAPTTAAGYPDVAAALGELLGVEVAVLTTLADAADTLMWGLDRAGTAYRSVEASTTSTMRGAG